MVSGSLHLLLGPLPPCSADGSLPATANGTPEQEERTSASAAPAYYNQAPRPPASPSRPEQHTVIHMGGSEHMTHGEPGDCLGQRRIEEGWGRSCEGSLGPETHLAGPFLTLSTDVTTLRF